MNASAHVEEMITTSKNGRGGNLRTLLSYKVRMVIGPCAYVSQRGSRPAAYPVMHVTGVLPCSEV
jgi:hypothetical protein